jgi:hypothetical protein
MNDSRWYLLTTLREESGVESYQTTECRFKHPAGKRRGEWVDCCDEMSLSLRVSFSCFRFREAKRLETKNGIRRLYSDGGIVGSEYSVLRIPSREFLMPSVVFVFGSCSIPIGSFAAVLFFVVIEVVSRDLSAKVDDGICV